MMAWLRDTNRPSTPTEVFVGRLLAFWAHPVVAWRVGSRGGRVAILSGYVAVGYVAMLTALLLFKSPALPS